MRILQVHTRYRQRGGEDAVVDVERALLEDAGHTVHQHLEENPTNAVAAAGALAGAVWNPLAARRAATAADAVRPDVVHLHNTWFAMSPAVLTAFRRRRIPVVMTVHHNRLACANALLQRDGAPCEECLDGDVGPAIRNRCYRGSRTMSTVAATTIAVHRRAGTWARGVDRFVALSEFARGRLVRAGLPADRIVVGSNFVQDPGLRSTPPSACDEVMFVGRISPEKGLDVLLEAWRRASPAGLRLAVVGDGPAREPLLADLPAGVEYAGTLPPAEVISRMRGARALVLPSVWFEGQPVTALEGMATGTPLVLSDIGGLPEVLGGTNRGLLVPPRRPEALAAALARLSHPGLVDRLGEYSRQRYLETFTPASALARLEALYGGVQERVDV